MVLDNFVLLLTLMLSTLAFGLEVATNVNDPYVTLLFVVYILL